MPKKNKTSNECFIVAMDVSKRFYHEVTEYDDEGMPKAKVTTLGHEVRYITSSWENCKGYMEAANDPHIRALGKN